MRRRQTSQFQCGVRGASPPHCQDATFHVATNCGALHPRCCDRPSWNTQHLPFVNPVLYNWSVFNAPTSHQRMLSSWKLEAGSWKRRIPRPPWSCGTDCGQRPGSRQHWPSGSTDTVVLCWRPSVVHLSRFKVPSCTVRECLTSQCRLKNQVKAYFYQVKAGLSAISA